MNITLILSWIWVNLFKLGLLGILVVNIKKVINIFILQPLQGHDNHTAMDELAKYIILGLLIWVIYVNGARTTEWAPYSDATIGILVGGVFAIAAIQPVTSIFKKKDKDSKSLPEQRIEE